MLELKNITMKFNMSKEKIDSLKEYFVKLIKRQLMYTEFTALSDVSLTVKKGEVIKKINLKNSCKNV